MQNAENYFVKIILFFFEILFYLKETRLLFYIYTMMSVGKIRVVAVCVNLRRKHNFEIVLAYYLPYHGKYDPVERCWVRIFILGYRLAV